MDQASIRGGAASSTELRSARSGRATTLPIKGTTSGPILIECTEKAPPPQRQTEEPPKPSSMSMSSTWRGRSSGVIPFRWSKTIGEGLIIASTEKAGPPPPQKPQQEPPKAMTTSTSLGSSMRPSRVGKMPIRYTTEIGEGLLSSPSPIAKAQPPQREKQTEEREPPAEARSTAVPSSSTSTRRGRSSNIRIVWSKKIGEGWVTNVMESQKEGLPKAKAAEEEEEEEESESDSQSESESDADSDVGPTYHSLASILQLGPRSSPTKKLKRQRSRKRQPPLPSSSPHKRKVPATTTSGTSASCQHMKSKVQDPIFPPPPSSPSHAPSSSSSFSSLTALQRRFPLEDFEQISPEWQLEWCRPFKTLAKEKLLCVPTEKEHGPYNGVLPQDWDELRTSVIKLVVNHRADDPGIKVEKIAGQATRRFVYAPVISNFCAHHNLITNGPWVPFVKSALGLKEEVSWSHCMGIYVLFSEPSAAPLLWHTDFCPDDGGGREGGRGKRGREEYLHNLINVLVPMQALDEAIGFTVVLDKEEGRRRVQVRRQGHWYALDPGYPHAADGNNRPIAPGNERLMLNITYVHPSFPHVLRRHVISHLEYYKQHLPRSVWKE